MTDTYNDTTGSRKKFLIPLVVLLLCAVSLTGAGYAYNSTVTVNNNTAPVDPGDFALEVYDNAATPALLTGPITLADTKLVVATVTTLVADPADDTVVTNVYQSATAYKGMIKVTSTDFATSAVLSCAEIDPITIEKTAVGADDGELTITIAVAFFSDAECTTPLASNTVTITAGVGTAYYKISVTVDGDFTFNNNTPAVDSAAVMAKLVNQSFDLAFTAVSTPATA